VTLYTAGDGEPIQIARGTSSDDGTFRLDVGATAHRGEYRQAAGAFAE
jgi:hypothetical protein